MVFIESSAANVLVFNNGRTVKLADFGSAMHMDDVSSIAVGSLKGCSPHFAAPEVGGNGILKSFKWVGSTHRTSVTSLVQ